MWSFPTRVARNMVKRVCVCAGHPGELCKKKLNRSRLVWPKVQYLVLDDGPNPPRWGNFWGQDLRISACIGRFLAHAMEECIYRRQDWKDVYSIDARDYNGGCTAAIGDAAIYLIIWDVCYYCRHRHHCQPLILSFLVGSMRKVSTWSYCRSDYKVSFLMS